MHNPDNLERYTHTSRIWLSDSPAGHMGKWVYLADHDAIAQIEMRWQGLPDSKRHFGKIALRIPDWNNAVQVWDVTNTGHGHDGHMILEPMRDIAWVVERCSFETTGVAVFSISQEEAAALLNDYWQRDNLMRQVMPPVPVTAEGVAQQMRDLDDLHRAGAISDTSFASAVDAATRPAEGTEPRMLDFRSLSDIREVFSSAEARLQREIDADLMRTIQADMAPPESLSYAETEIRSRAQQTRDLDSLPDIRQTLVDNSIRDMLRDTDLGFIHAVNAAMGPQEMAVNARQDGVTGGITRSDVAEALQHIRTSDDHFMRRVLPPIQNTAAELDRSVDTDIPVRIMEAVLSDTRQEVDIDEIRTYVPLGETATWIRAYENAGWVRHNYLLRRQVSGTTSPRVETYLLTVEPIQELGRPVTWVIREGGNITGYAHTLEEASAAVGRPLSPVYGVDNNRRTPLRIDQIAHEHWHSIIIGYMDIGWTRDSTWLYPPGYPVPLSPTSNPRLPEYATDVMEQYREQYHNFIASGMGIPGTLFEAAPKPPAQPEPVLGPAKRKLRTIRVNKTVASN